MVRIRMLVNRRPHRLKGQVYEVETAEARSRLSMKEAVAVDADDGVETTDAPTAAEKRAAAEKAAAEKAAAEKAGKGKGKAAKGGKDGE